MFSRRVIIARPSGSHVRNAIRTVRSDRGLFFICFSSTYLYCRLSFRRLIPGRTIHGVRCTSALAHRSGTTRSRGIPDERARKVRRRIACLGEQHGLEPEKLLNGRVRPVRYRCRVSSTGCTKNTRLNNTNFERKTANATRRDERRSGRTVRACV